MGIKTKFNPLGGRSGEEDKGNLSLWRYSNDIIAGKTLLYNYTGSDWVNTIYVPKAGGNAIINDWDNSTTSGTTDANRNTPFYNNLNVVNVDLQEVPFRDSSMYFTFYGCQNLTFVNNISNSVANMQNAFLNCYSLNQNIQIPNSVTDITNTFHHCFNLNQNIQIPNSITNMSHTFFSCSNLNQNIQIPNSVKNMARAFSYCHNLNQNIQIPNSVINMFSTFAFCYNLDQNIKIPNSVTNIANTFEYCHNLKQNIQIPNSIRNMSQTFANCYNLNQNIQIPNGVTDMFFTFYNCHNLKCAYIHSANVNDSDMAGCFINTNNGNTHVVIPSRYIDNTVTTTYNSLKTAGWTITNQGALVGPTDSKIHGWDIIQGDYPTYTANGTHYILQKWGGNLSANLNNNNPVLNVEVPKYYNTYNVFPTAFTAACFSANRIITNLDLGQSMLSGTSGINAFRNMSNCLSITNINIPTGVTNIISLFPHCNNVSSISTGGRIPNTAYLVLPTGLTHLGSCLGYTANANLKDYYTFGRDITNLQFGLAHINNRNVNFFIEAANATSIANIGNGVGTSYRKNIYIHFKYSNGVATKTFNLFKGATFMGTSGNTSFANPSYNSTSKWYIYNINPASVFTYSSYNITNYNDASPIKCLALMPQYPDYSMPTWVSNNTFNNATTVQAIDFRNVRFNYSNLVNAFAECRNLCSITNLNSTINSTNWFRTFYNCSNLHVVERDGGNGFINLANSTNVAGLFWNVQNLRSMPFTGFDSDNALTINSQITNLFGTFSGCTKFNSNLVGLSDSITNMSHTFSNCWNLNQNIQYRTV